MLGNLLGPRKYYLIVEMRGAKFKALFSSKNYPIVGQFKSSDWLYLVTKEAFDIEIDEIPILVLRFLFIFKQESD